ncbi:MAG: DUF2147 domain-containing protein [Lewinellaceae bacterium]|nr:DUF2147 domain-containing protein [Lewinellaceae bacterium]
MKRLLFSLLYLTCFITITNAQSGPLGTWKTIDDATGEAKSYVEIYQDQGKYFGKVVKLLKSSPDKICTECTGKKKNQPLIGLVVIEDLEPYKDYWSNGTIMDPENGSEYRCSIWFEPGNSQELKVRGKHWTGLYRTQTWYRVTSDK